MFRKSNPRIKHGDEALLMLDRWMAGFAHAVSGGLTTAIRGEDGQIHEVEHSFLWSMGVLAGTSTSFLVGFQAPAAMAGQVGATKWAANFLRVFDAATDTALLNTGCCGIII